MEINDYSETKMIITGWRTYGKPFLLYTFQVFYNERSGLQTLES